MFLLLPFPTIPDATIVAREKEPWMIPWVLLPLPIYLVTTLCVFRNVLLVPPILFPTKVVMWVGKLSLPRTTMTSVRGLSFPPWVTLVPATCPGPQGRQRLLTLASLYELLTSPPSLGASPFRLLTEDKTSLPSPPSLANPLNRLPTPLTRILLSFLAILPWHWSTKGTAVFLFNSLTACLIRLVGTPRTWETRVRNDAITRAALPHPNCKDNRPAPTPS